MPSADTQLAVHNQPAYLLTEWAAGAADRYRLLLFVLGGATTRAVDTSGHLAAVKHTLARDLEKLVGTHMGGEGQILLSRALEIAGVAQARAYSDLGLSKPDATLPENLLTLVTGSAHALVKEVWNQASRDADAARAHARRQAMAINMVSTSQGVNLITAAIEVQRSRKVVEFGARDRAGRLWGAENFIRTVVRHHLLTIYNDTYLSVLADHGVMTAKVQADTPAHRYDGVLFSIVPTPGVDLTYEMIRSQIFHPNSNCLCAIA